MSYRIEDIEKELALAVRYKMDIAANWLGSLLVRAKYGRQGGRKVTHWDDKHVKARQAVRKHRAGPLRVEGNGESVAPGPIPSKAPSVPAEPVIVRTERTYDRTDRVWITRGLDDQGMWHELEREQVYEGA